MKTRLSYIKDWASVAMLLGVNPRDVGHAITHKESLTRKITIPKPGGKIRTTYESLGTLSVVQKAIEGVLNELYMEFDAASVIAYRKGVNARAVIAQELSGWCDYTVHVDIKACYDFITFGKITETLQYFGAPEEGAKKLAKLCCVKRHVNGRPLYSCQQGSTCGPVVANLAGYVLLDRHLLPWVEQRCWELGIRYKIYRYSDNIIIGVAGARCEEFIPEYKEKLRSVLSAAKFIGKDWATVSRNHPKKNQQFLGIVLNNAPRMDLNKYKRIEATMLNLARTGMHRDHLEKWCKKERPELLADKDNPWWEAQVREMALMWAQGMSSSIKAINLKQYYCLRKLHLAMKVFGEAFQGAGELPPTCMETLKRFSFIGDTPEKFAELLQAATKTTKAA